MARPKKDKNCGTNIRPCSSSQTRNMNQIASRSNSGGIHSQDLQHIRVRAGKQPFLYSRPPAPQLLAVQRYE